MRSAELRDKQEKIESERKEKESAWREGESDVKMVVDEDVIAEVISQTTGIPVFKLTQPSPRSSWAWRANCTSASSVRMRLCPH